MLWTCCFWFSSNHSRITRLNISQMTWQQHSEWFDRVNVYKIKILLHLMIACSAWNEKSMKMIVCDFHLRKQWIRRSYDFRDYSSTSIFTQHLNQRLNFWCNASEISKRFYLRWILTRRASHTCFQTIHFHQINWSLYLVFEWWSWVKKKILWLRWSFQWWSMICDFQNWLDNAF